MQKEGQCNSSADSKVRVLAAIYSAIHCLFSPCMVQTCAKGATGANKCNGFKKFGGHHSRRKIFDRYKIDMAR